MKGSWFRFVVVLCLVFVSCFSVGEVEAKGKAISISPVNQKMLLQRGEVYRGTFSVANPAQASGELHYSIAVGPYNIKKGAGSKDDYGDYEIGERTSWNMMVDWVKIENPEGVISPNGSATIAFSIEVPEDAPAGAQYAALLVRDAEDIEGNQPGGIREIMQMAHVLYATVAGETIETAEIVNNDVPAFVLDGELKTSARVKNSGNVYGDATYILQVWPNGSEEEICTNEEDMEAKLVLPATERDYEMKCKLPSAGLYKVKQTVRIFGEESIIETMVVYCPIWLIMVNLLGSGLIVTWAAMTIVAKKNAAGKMMRKR